MFEAIWNALDFWQRFGVIMLGVMIPVGAVAQVLLDRDVWALQWSEMKRKFHKN